jgi:Tfp pilus assembly protein PilN
MIRINLLPQKKKKKATRGSAVQVGGENPRSIAVLVIFVLGWGALVGAAYYLLDLEVQREAQTRAESAAVLKQIEDLRKQIDEERLQAIRAQVEQLRTAIAQLQERKRTPVFVMHEISNVLTQGKLPEIDLEEQLKTAAQDPDSELNQTWDGTTVWLTALSQEGDLITINGGARDASDLSEFVKRMRASARFHEVSHAEFTTQTKAGTGAGAGVRYVTFNMSAKVAFWD